MSKTPSVLVSRSNPDYKNLVKLFRREKDGDNVKRLHAIILMLDHKNSERVAKICKVNAETVRRWVKGFNDGGLDGLLKKKDQVDPLS